MSFLFLSSFPPPSLLFSLSPLPLFTLCILAIYPLYRFRGSIITRVCLSYFSPPFLPLLFSSLSLPFLSLRYVFWLFIPYTDLEEVLLQGYVFLISLLLSSPFSSLLSLSPSSLYAMYFGYLSLIQI